MDLVIFNTLIGAVRGVLGLAKDLSDADDERREKVAAWMQELGELIKDIADKLEINDYPHDTCAQMEVMVDHFPMVVGDHIEPAKLEALTETLRSCTRVEQLFGEASTLDKEQRDDMIIQLLNSSGRLQGLASIIKYAE